MLNLLRLSGPLPDRRGSANIWVGRAFFIWTSVFNLFVVSVFWAFIVDVFTSEQGKRLFGFIAAAATIGGILGASVTAEHGPGRRRAGLLLGRGGLLEIGVFASRRLARVTGGLRVAGRPPATRPPASVRSAAARGPA